jgi:peptidoglycan/LPS O-acetylase OafA/YrhL
MRTHRSFYLDFIRSISILLIIFYHYNVWTEKTILADYTLVKEFVFAGSIGVSLFFIISGASLMLSTRDKYEVINFYKKRFISIFPLFYFIYIFFVLTYAIIFRMSPFQGRNPLTFPLTIIGMDGFLVYEIQNYYLIGEWFLGCLIIIYSLYPLIRHIFIANKHLCLLASFILWIFIYNVYNFNMGIDRFPLFRIFEFVFGMYFGSIYKTNSLNSNIKLLATALIGIIVIFNFALTVTFSLWHTILGMLSFVFLASLASVFENKISGNVIDFLSKYAYAAFLLHHITLRGILYYFKNSINSIYLNLLIFVLTVAVILLMSYIIYNLFRYTIRLPAFVKVNEGQIP